jgi:acyl carrier protein
VSGRDPETTTPAPPLRLRDRLAAALPAARPRVLVEFILQALHDELGVEGDDLHPRARFESLGVDSKRALEWKELLEEELQCMLRTTLMFDYPTPESLAAYIVRVAFGAPEDAAMTRATDARPDELPLPAAPERAGDPGDEALSIEDQLRRKLAQYDI